MSARFLASLVLSALFSGCTTSATLGPAESDVPVVVTAELSSTSVLARPPMLDSARVAGSVAGMVAVIGLLNQTAPCYALSADARRTGTSIRLRVIATEQPGTCATFAAGAFDYDVAVRGMPAGTYDVSVAHRVVHKDGRVDEATIAARRVEVR